MKEKTVGELGRKRMQEILGNSADKIVENFRKISPDFADYIVNFAYGDIYARSGLSDKSKELAAVSSLISQGKMGLPLKSHVHGMLNVGWTQKEILELIIFLAAYVGFPSAVEAILVAQEVFDSRM